MELVGKCVQGKYYFACGETFLPTICPETMRALVAREEGDAEKNFCKDFQFCKSRRCNHTLHTLPNWCTLEIVEDKAIVSILCFISLEIERWLLLVQILGIRDRNKTCCKMLLLWRINQHFYVWEKGSFREWINSNLGNNLLIY